MWGLDSAGRRDIREGADGGDAQAARLPDLNSRTFFDFADDAELKRHGQARSDISRPM